MWNSNLSFPFPFLVKHIQLLELSLFLTRNARTWICWCRPPPEYCCFYHPSMIPVVLSPATSGEENVMIPTRFTQIMILLQIISVINIITLPVSALAGSRQIFGCAELELITFMTNCKSVFETMVFMCLRCWSILGHSLHGVLFVQAAPSAKFCEVNVKSC